MIEELTTVYIPYITYTYYIKGSIFMDIFISLYFKITELNILTKMLLFW